MESEKMSKRRVGRPKGSKTKVSDPLKYDTEVSNNVFFFGGSLLLIGILISNDYAGVIGYGLVSFAVGLSAGLQNAKRKLTGKK